MSYREPEERILCKVCGSMYPDSQVDLASICDGCRAKPWSPGHDYGPGAPARLDSSLLVAKAGFIQDPMAKPDWLVAEAIIQAKNHPPLSLKERQDLDAFGPWILRMQRDLQDRLRYRMTMHHVLRMEELAAGSQTHRNTRLVQSREIRGLIVVLRQAKARAWELEKRRA